MTNVALCTEVADWAEVSQKTQGTAVAFDMTDWINSGEFFADESESGEVPIEKLREGSCGTAACVAG